MEESGLSHLQSCDHVSINCYKRNFSYTRLYHHCAVLLYLSTSVTNKVLRKTLKTLLGVLDSCKKGFITCCTNFLLYVSSKLKYGHKVNAKNEQVRNI